MTPSSLSKRFKVPKIWLAFIAVLAFCLVFRVWDVHESWNEQVNLPDGREIFLKRKLIADRFGEPSAKHGKIKQWTIREEGGGIYWQGSIEPISFNLNGDYAYIAARVEDMNDCAMYGFPNPPIVFFKTPTANVNWTVIERSDLPVKMPPNLLILGSRLLRDIPEYVSDKRKSFINRMDFTAQQFGYAILNGADLKVIPQRADVGCGVFSR